MSGNRIIAGISGGIPKATGVQVFGHDNSLWFDVLNVDPQRGLVLEDSAHDNLVLSANLAGGLTNRARTPTFGKASELAPFLDFLDLPQLAELNVSTLWVIADRRIILCARDNQRDMLLQIRRVEAEHEE